MLRHAGRDAGHAIAGNADGSPDFVLAYLICYENE